MSLYYPTRQPSITPNILVRKERLLPVAGDVLVRTGTRVEPDDIVASALVPQPPVIVDLARLLDETPARTAKLLARQPGQDVEAGDVLASRRGLFSMAGQVKSPVSGT